MPFQALLFPIGLLPPILPVGWWKERKNGSEANLQIHREADIVYIDKAAPE